MKQEKQNIFRLLRTIFMIAGMVLMLSACNQIGLFQEEPVVGEESDLDEAQRTCWQAAILSSFYKVMGKAATAAYPKVTASAMPFMMVAFAVWLSIRLLKHVSAVTPQNLAEVWTEISRMFFTCLVCGILASQTSFLFFVLNKLIFPLYYAFLEYGGAVLNAMKIDPNSDGIYLGNSEDGFCLIYDQPIVCQPPELEAVTNDHFPSGPSVMMQCLTCAINDRMNIGFQLGTKLMMIGSLSSVVCGMILFAIFLIVKLDFVLYVVDSIFRMTIMLILLPCFILAYPFKFSRKWTKIGFVSILNSAAILAFIAIMVSMALLAMQMILVENADLFVTENFADAGIMPLSLILIGFLVLKSIEISVALAGTLVGGNAGTDFQKKLGKAAAQAGKAVIHAISAGAGKMFTAFIDKHEKLKDIHDKAQQMKKQFQEQMKKMAGRNNQ